MLSCGAFVVLRLPPAPPTQPWYVGVAWCRCPASNSRLWALYSLFTVCFQIVLACLACALRRICQVAVALVGVKVVVIVFSGDVVGCHVLVSVGAHVPAGGPLYPVSKDDVHTFASEIETVLNYRRGLFFGFLSAVVKEQKRIARCSSNIGG